MRSQMSWLMGGEATDRERMRAAIQAQVRGLQARKDEAAQAMAQVVVCRERVRARLAQRIAGDDKVQKYLADFQFDLARKEFVNGGMLEDTELAKMLDRLDQAQYAAKQKLAAYHQAEADLEQMQAEYQDAIWAERAGQIRQQFENSLLDLTDRLSPRAARTPRAALEEAADRALQAAEEREARETLMTDYAAALEAEIRLALSDPGVEAESGEEPEWVRESRSPEADSD